MHDEYRPPRFIVGKILFSLLVAYLLIVVAGRIWWGRYADRQLATRIDAIRQRGEPLDWREMFGPPVPDEQNAAVLYEQITRDEGFKKALAMKPEFPPDEFGFSDTKRVRDLLADSKFRRENPAALKEYLDNCQSAFKLIRQARARPLYRPQIPADATDQQIAVSALKSFQGMANALKVAALASHDAGNDGDAVEYVRDQLAVSRAAVQGPTMLINELVATAISPLVVYELEEMLPTLKIGPAPACSPQQARDLLAELLVMHSGREFARSFQGERTFAVQSIRLIMHQEPSAFEHWSNDLRPGPWGADFVMRPIWPLQVAQVLGAHTAYMDKALQGKPLTGPEPKKGNLENPFWAATHALFEGLAPMFSRAGTLFHRGQAATRMAAVALAIKIYQLDHGHRPAALVELVPDYLPAVPFDPFSDPPKALAYLPNLPHPILYSIGSNGTDDGGKYVLLGPYSRNDGDKLDTPFFLNGDREAAWQEMQPPASTQPFSAPGQPGGFNLPSPTTTQGVNK